MILSSFFVLLVIMVLWKLSTNAAQLLRFWCICCHWGQWIWLCRLFSAFRKYMTANDICDVLFTFGWCYVTGSYLISLVTLQPATDWPDVPNIERCVVNHIPAIVPYDSLAMMNLCLGPFMWHKSHILGYSYALYRSCMVRLRNLLGVQTNSA